MKILQISNNNFESFLQEIFSKVQSIAEDAIHKRNVFHLALSGGNSIKKFLSFAKHQSIDINHWNIWMVDERSYPEFHPELNATLLRDEFLDPLKFSKTQFHPMEYFSPGNSNILEYRKYLQDIPIFDLTVLGIGNDGHVASIFPGKEIPSVDLKEDVVLINDSPKPPSHRMSLSIHRINQSECIYALAFGTDKLELLNLLESDQRLPANQLKAKTETKFWFYTN